MNIGHQTPFPLNVSVYVSQDPGHSLTRPWYGYQTQERLRGQHAAESNTVHTEIRPVFKILTLIIISPCDHELAFSRHVSLYPKPFFFP